MVYLMREWLVDQKNEDAVRGILNELDQDVQQPDSKSVYQALTELEKLGETKIVAMIKGNEIPFGA